MITMKYMIHYWTLNVVNNGIGFSTNCLFLDLLYTKIYFLILNSAFLIDQTLIFYDLKINHF